MFDVAPTELIVLGTVALLVIPPKDLPRAMRTAGYWIGRARGVARQFRSGFDTMVRDAELAEMEKRWKAENERIMREHPPTRGDDIPADTNPAPAMVERPELTDPSSPSTVADSPPTVTEPRSAEPQAVEGQIASQPIDHQSIEHPAVIPAAPPAAPAADAGASS